MKSWMAPRIMNSASGRVSADSTCACPNSRRETRGFRFLPLTCTESGSGRSGPTLRRMAPCFRDAGDSATVRLDRPRSRKVGRVDHRHLRAPVLPGCPDLPEGLPLAEEPGLDLLEPRRSKRLPVEPEDLLGALCRGVDQGAHALDLRLHRRPGVRREGCKEPLRLLASPQVGLSKAEA